MWISDLCPRCSSCPISSRLRRPSLCLPLQSGRRSCHLWTLSTGTTIITWCRSAAAERLLWSDCWQHVPAALQSHQTVECREKLFAQWILKTFREKRKKKKPYLVAFQNRSFACVETTAPESRVLAVRLAKCSWCSEHSLCQEKNTRIIEQRLWPPFVTWEIAGQWEQLELLCSTQGLNPHRISPSACPILLWHWFKEALLFEIPGLGAFAQSDQILNPNPRPWGLCHLSHTQADNHRPSLLEIRRPFVEEWTSQIAQFQKTGRVSSSDSTHCDAELPLQDQSRALHVC